MTAVTRKKDWPERLVAFIEAAEAQPFVWGKTDCMQFALGAVEAMTGENPYPKATGYGTRAGAMRCLKCHGFASVVEALAAKFEMVAPAMARRGDLGIVMEEESPAAAVCDGLFFVGKTPRGNIRVPRSLVIQAFRVD
jgi:hypothetical protein